jgi:pyroglutamyl-peptidase
VETRARNAVSALIRDAEGQRTFSTYIEPNGPGALPFGAPSARLALAAGGARVQAVISRDAGRYLCNYLGWRAIEAAAKPSGPKLVAFIHVPKLRHGAFRRGRPRPWRMTDLLRSGEAILLAAVAATRQRRMKER